MEFVLIRVKKLLSKKMFNSNDFLINDHGHSKILKTHSGGAAFGMKFL